MNFKLSLFGTGVMVAAGSWLIAPLGVLGAAYSLLIATTIETAARVSVFQWLTRDDRPGMRSLTGPPSLAVDAG